MKEKERDRVKETERDAKQARFFLVRRGNVKEPCLVWKRARRREGAFDKTATNRGVKRDGRERPSLCLSLVKRISCGELWARIHASVTSTRLRARSRLTKRGEEKRRRSTVSSRQARLASTMLRPWVLTVSHPSGREHTRTRVPPTARHDPTKRERERECVGWPAGRPVRSLARSLTHSHSLCRNLFRLRTFLLSRRLFLSGENRTHAGRRAGEQAGRVPRCVVPRRARADSAGSGPILKTINGRQAAFSPQKFNSPPSTVVARCSLYRAFLFPPFFRLVSFFFLDRSLVLPAFPLSLRLF